MYIKTHLLKGGNEDQYDGKTKTELNVEIVVIVNWGEGKTTSWEKYRLLPNSGMASETWGSVSATKLRNTVNESKMVTPEKYKHNRKKKNPPSDGVTE